MSRSVWVMDFKMGKGTVFMQCHPLQCFDATGTLEKGIRNPAILERLEWRDC
ncbi:hypothetical protein JCM17845_03140 [Iodidimonas gelatinilytica]|uniref:Uncharacterized protein n=1 Tax=Iodidimonas gelatinilytica TaxID=1236966 RepID=A0A5A7MUL3_9PROT|nr:hypothetical protein JCM17845_03140 [Iodidimonas gelatinilytica]